MIERMLEPGCVVLLDDEDERMLVHVWRLHNEGYAIRQAWTEGRARTIYMHRELLGLLDAPRTVQVDHINRNRLDNRRFNLRVVTNRENSQNSPGRSGRYRGAYFNKGKGCWMARVKLDYRSRFLGCYETELEAGRAAEAFRRIHMPAAVAVVGLEPIPACACRQCRETAA